MSFVSHRAGVEVFGHVTVRRMGGVDLFNRDKIGGVRRST